MGQAHTHTDNFKREKFSVRTYFHCVPRKFSQTSKTIYISNNVCISQGALLLCGNHNYKKSSFDLMVGEITLEDGVWICAKVIITQNVVCKNHSVISTGATLNSSTEPYFFYSGNPAIKTGERIIVN